MGANEGGHHSSAEGADVPVSSLVIPSQGSLRTVCKDEGWRSEGLDIQIKIEGTRWLRIIFVHAETILHFLPTTYVPSIH